MPIYEEEGRITRDDLYDLKKRNKCSVCGDILNVFMDFDASKAFLACKDWPRTHHEGIERAASRYEMEGLASLNIEARKNILVKEYGMEKTKALERYTGGGAITKSIATDIVETLWGGAPIIEKAKCILLCQTYQLNPLMKHIYLVGYKRKINGKVVLDQDGHPVLDWSIQIGIGATRLMAQRKHSYSYLDMTPRKATKAEIEKILGDTADPNCIYGFVHIRDVNTGAEAFGLRGIGKFEKIQGTEKGNTHLNMACVRAERLALDRQYPGEMPQGIEVVDERYAELPDVGKVDTSTEEIVKAEVVEVNEPTEATQDHWCEEHGCAYERKVRGSSVWYAHKLPDSGWCNEAKKQGNAPKPEPEPEFVSVPEEEVTDGLTAEEQNYEAAKADQPKRALDTIKTLNELFKACNEDFKLQPAEVIKELGVSSQSDISDTPAECYLKIAAVR